MLLAGKNVHPAPGVGVGPCEVGVDVAVGVDVGVRVAVGVDVGVRVAVEVRVAVGVRVRVGVAVGRRVAVGAGVRLAVEPAPAARGSRRAGGAPESAA
jgi:hypothetical protein